MLSRERCYACELDYDSTFILRSDVLIGLCVLFFFFNDTATTEIYTLSLHDALPISRGEGSQGPSKWGRTLAGSRRHRGRRRSEEHTSELQSRQYLVCRLLLEKKKKSQCSWLASRFTLRLLIYTELQSAPALL